MPDKNPEDILAKIEEAKRRGKVAGITGKRLSTLNLQRTANVPPVTKKPVQPTNRNHKVHRHTAMRGNAIFLTGGIGDIFAVESFMTDEERKKTTTVYYATIKQPQVEELMRSLPNFPLLKKHLGVWNDFSHFWCFYTLKDCLFRLAATKKAYPSDLQFAKDLSIAPFFEDIKLGKRTLTGSSFLKHRLVDVNQFSLPKKYVVVCPYSTDKRLNGRDFEKSDWDECCRLLEYLGLTGVIVNSGKDQMPESKYLIDLSNKTRILEAVEILKSASGYIGIDSCFSVLASQLFDPPFLAIKSRNPHCYSNLECYYPNKSNYSFISQSITFNKG